MTGHAALPPPPQSAQPRFIYLLVQRRYTVSYHAPEGQPVTFMEHAGPGRERDTVLHHVCLVCTLTTTRN